MKTLKDAWTFDIEWVEIMKSILRGSSTYHKNHVSIIVINLGDMARACHSLSRPHLSTTSTNPLSSPIVFKKTLPRPPCLLSPSEPMAQLPLSPSPTKLFLAPPQFQLQVDPQDDNMPYSESYASQDYPDRLPKFLRSNASEDTYTSFPYTPSASELRIYEHISTSEPTFSSQHRFHQCQLHWDIAPPVRNQIPHIPGRRYYTYALTPEDRYHLIAGHAIGPDHHPLGKRSHNLGLDSLEEGTNKVRRPRSLFTPTSSPLRSQHLRRGSTFHDFLQPHQFGKNDPAYSAEESPKESLRKRLRKKIGQGAATLKLKRRKTLH